MTTESTEHDGSVIGSGSTSGDLPTAEERARIRAEELFRQEVRQHLAAKQTRSARIWSFLGSSLGIWFLSTIAVGALTWGYTEWQDARARERQLLHLVMEVHFRVVQSAFSARIPIEQPAQHDDDLTLSQKLRRAVFGEGTSIFPEFKDRTLQSLVVEISELAPSEDRKLWDELRDIANRLQDVATRLKDDDDEIYLKMFEHDMRAGIDILRKLQDTRSYDVWRHF